jgi:hypothetical protein
VTDRPAVLSAVFDTGKLSLMTVALVANKSPKSLILFIALALSGRRKAAGAMIPSYPMQNSPALP